jgi:hypothetical protein
LTKTVYIFILNLISTKALKGACLKYEIL